MKGQLTRSWLFWCIMCHCSKTSMLEVEMIGICVYFHRDLAVLQEQMDRMGMGAHLTADGYVLTQGRLLQCIQILGSGRMLV